MILHMHMVPRMSAAKQKTSTQNRDGKSGSVKCPIMYKRSTVIPAANTPRKSFQLALAYALSVGRQEDVADACGVHQSTMSRWLRGRGPTNGRLIGFQRKLVGYVERCNRGLRRALPILLLTLFLTACGSHPYRVNPGSDIALILAPADVVTREYQTRTGEQIDTGRHIAAFYDRDAKELHLAGPRSLALYLRAYTHDLLIHVMGDTETAARLTSPQWDLMYTDAPADVEAAAKALAEYRRASK